jgi:DNA polymerase-1
MDATKTTHKGIRDVCKTVVLGTNYGMGAESLAYRTGLSKIEAQELLRKLAIAFPTFKEWAQHVVDVAQLTGRLSTVFGWTIRVTGDSRPTSLRNYPMQANGAEMLRIACCLATERGIDVCAPVHDALLIEAPAGEISDAVAATRTAMADASRMVLDVEVPTDVDIVHWPDRYADPRGAVMWARVTELI